jgi:hypothetical protein
MKICRGAWRAIKQKKFETGQFACLDGDCVLGLPPSWGLRPEQLTARTAAIADTFWKA